MTMMPQKPIYKRGDVVLVIFPHSNLRGGKTRPAVVVQADNLQTGLNQTIVAMITSNLARAEHPSRIMLTHLSHEGRQAGLLTDSVVMTDNLATIADIAIYRVIGKLPMSKINRALRYTLGLRPPIQ